MKTLAKTVLIAMGIAALTACGEKAENQEATENPSATEAALPAPETPPQPADEWVTKPDTGVDVTLPETPMTTETATPTPGNEQPKAPEAGQ